MDTKLKQSLKKLMTSHSGGGAHDGRYYIKTEIDTFLNGKANSNHTHTKSQITDFPTSMPASDVYSWAKASSKPSYSWSEITGKPSTFTPTSHTHDYLPLSGGSLSGQLNMNGNVIALNWSNSIDGSGGVDAASLSNGDGCNLMIRSWYGVGFYDVCSGGGTSVAIDCRSGSISFKGNLISAQGAQYTQNGNVYMPWAGCWLSDAINARPTSDGYVKWSHALRSMNQDVYVASTGVTGKLSTWTMDGHAYDNVLTLGSGSNRWGQLYSITSSISTSDRNLKDNIKPLTDQHIQFFLLLQPVSFTFKDGTSGRTHIGFIAQDVEQAMHDVGLTDLDFAGFCKDIVMDESLVDGVYTSEPVLDEDGNPTYIYSLRYEEFIALNTYMIQEIYKRLLILENNKSV